MFQAIVLLICFSVGSANTCILGAGHYPQVYPLLRPFGFVPLPFVMPVVDPYYKFFHDAMMDEITFGPLFPRPSLPVQPLAMPLQVPDYRALPLPRFASYQQAHFPSKPNSPTRRHIAQGASLNSLDWHSQENDGASSEKQLTAFNYDLVPPRWHQFRDDQVVNKEAAGTYQTDVTEKLSPYGSINQRDTHSIREDWPALSNGITSAWETGSPNSNVDSSRLDEAIGSRTLQPSINRPGYHFVTDAPQKESMPIPDERPDFVLPDKLFYERDVVSPSTSEKPVSSVSSQIGDKRPNSDAAPENGLAPVFQGSADALQMGETVPSRWAHPPPAYQIWEPVAHRMLSLPQKWELARPEKEKSPPSLRQETPVDGAEQSNAHRDVRNDPSAAPPVSKPASVALERLQESPVRHDLTRHEQIQLEKVWPHPSFTRRMISPAGTSNVASSLLYEGSKGLVSLSTTSTSPEKPAASSDTSVLLAGGEGKGKCAEEHADSVSLHSHQGEVPSSMGNNIQDFPRNFVANSLLRRPFNFYPGHQFYNTHFGL